MSYTSREECWGRECKLGWGWNRDLNLLIPVQGEPPNVTSEIKNEWGYWPYNLSSNNLQHWVSFSFAH